MSKESQSQAHGSRRWWYLILVLPFIATLFPQIYNSMTPAIGGLPFFYWFQLLWVLITGGLTILVYYLVR